VRSFASESAVFLRKNLRGGVFLQNTPPAKTAAMPRGGGRGRGNWRGRGGGFGSHKTFSKRLDAIRPCVGFLRERHNRAVEFVAAAPKAEHKLLRGLVEAHIHFVVLHGPRVAVHFRDQVVGQQRPRFQVGRAVHHKLVVVKAARLLAHRAQLRAVLVGGAVEVENCAKSVQIAAVRVDGQAGDVGAHGDVGPRGGKGKGARGSG
jgi:hypothetical protein